MMRPLLCLALLATGLSGCTGDAPDPEPIPSGRIDGALLDHLLRPWGTTEVRLVELDVSTQTTPRGGFSFVDVPAGIHTLEAVIDGVGQDRELVTVEADETTKIILQIFDFPPPEPYISALTHQARQQIAQAGDVCDDCRCSVRLHEEKPVAAVIQARWDGRAAPGSDTHLVMEVFDDDGARLLLPLDRSDTRTDADGMTTLTAVIDGELLKPTSDRIVVTFRFDRNNPMPHLDFAMETQMYLHYGMTEEASALLA